MGNPKLGSFSVNISFTQGRELEQPDVAVRDPEEDLAPALQSAGVQLVELVEVGVDHPVLWEAVGGPGGGGHDVGSQVEG